MIGFENIYLNTQFSQLSQNSLEKATNTAQFE